MNKDLKQGFYIGAGFALAWYCFMPNLNLLFREKIYKSQLIIHSNQLYAEARYFFNRVHNSRPEMIQWQECADYALKDLKRNWRDNINSEGNVFAESIAFLHQQNISINSEEYFEEQCGEKP